MSFSVFVFFFSCSLFKPTSTPKTPTYKVTFAVNGGSAVGSQTIEENKTATRPKNPTKADSLFVNWYSDKELRSVFDFATAITADITLYAEWRSDKATIRFLDKGAEYSDTQRILIGQKAKRPDMKLKDGYNFLGYFIDEQLTVPFDFGRAINENEVTVYVKYDELMFKYEGSVVTGLADNYKITGAKGKTNIILTIPASINGVKITDITRNNLDNNDNRFQLFAITGGAKKTPLHNIVKVILAEGILRINYKAFFYSKITNINIPSTVRTISDGALAFDKTTTIDRKDITVKIKCDPTTPPTIFHLSFDNVTPYEISVPAENLNAYKKANIWKSFHSGNDIYSISIVAQ